MFYSGNGIDGVDYSEIGQNVFYRFQRDPELFTHETSATKRSPDRIIDAAEVEPQVEEVSATDLLDSLVNMSVDGPSVSSSFMAERVTYDFEHRRSPDVPIQQTPPTSDVMESSSEQKLERPRLPTEDKHAGSEVASTHGSESVQGVRSIDRMERYLPLNVFP